jgi:Predicted hydrolases or acyltransferases (alpha/beta hydrolase superfamily)
MDSGKSGKKKGISRKILEIVCIIIAIILVFPVLFVIFHHIYLRIEAGKFVRPGQMVETENGKMHVYSKRGPAGTPTYVFLDAFGGGSAYYDFKMLWLPLSETASIATIDYLGYGMSDSTDAERTVQNIAAELEMALQATGLPGPYTFVSHSMGGLYAAGYALQHPDKVAALVMTDNTPPALSLIETSELDMLKSMKPRNDFMKFTGLVRFLGNKAVVPGLTEAEIDANTYHSRKMGLGDTVMNEMANTPANAAYLAENRVDDSIPLLVLLSAQNEELSKNMGWGRTWVEFHEADLTNNPNSRIEMFNTGHYIHRAEPEKVVETIQGFSAGLVR